MVAAAVELVVSVAEELLDMSAVVEADRHSDDFEECSVVAAAVVVAADVGSMKEDKFAAELVLVH